MKAAVTNVTRPDPWTVVDPLGDALGFLRMSGVFYCRSELTAPWALAIPPFERCMMLHVVTEGECRVEVDGGGGCLLPSGTLALVPHGEGHRLGSGPGLPAVGLFDAPREPVSERYEVLRLGGGGRAASMLCALVRVDHPAALNLIRYLPNVIRLDVTSSPQAEWLQSTIRLVAAEAREITAGGEAVITRLADILVLEAIRSWVTRHPEERAGWLGALRDKQIGHAVSLIQRDPARSWSVESLAIAIGMSRSAFSARFTELVGEPVMHYVTQWKMYAAAESLRREGTRLGELASQFGYSTEAAFSRAFKRVTGVSPGSVRRHDEPQRGRKVMFDGRSGMVSAPRGAHSESTVRRARPAGDLRHEQQNDVGAWRNRKDGPPHR